ncbi:MAG: hypothetical protein GY751_21970 [Bacteroidetes bacterium]|nr:hypothetical protein [Bacteroidota bacterium]
MRAMLLCNYDTNNAAMVIEHVNAIINYSKYEIFPYSKTVVNNGEIDIQLELSNFDIIIIHYSIFISVDNYLSEKSKIKLSNFEGIKIVFLQDEYRFIDKTILNLNNIGADLVFSCVPEKSIEKVYPKSRIGNIRVVNTLTGFPSDFLSILKPIRLHKRRYHVSYRGRRYPDWHGSMGLEKFEIAEKFLKHSRKFKLKTNISWKEKDRLYGANWTNLIQNSRAVLGVESGASVFDHSGKISGVVETQRALHGKKGISYETLRDRYFKEIENRIDLAQISPRIFEAICLRTMCILYEGHYSGILIPNVHYLPLKKDFSNIEDVCKKIKDDNYVSDIISNAYADIALNEEYSFLSFVRSLDSEIEAQLKMKPAIPSKRKSLNSFRKNYAKKYPFYMVRYPHGLSLQNSWRYRLIQSMKSRIPEKLKLRLKSLVR